MRQLTRLPYILPFFIALLISSCSRSVTERPFEYSFIKPLHLKHQADNPYSDYKAFYLLTEDFEPVLESSLDVESVREVLKFASSLSTTYKVPWTHFVDANALARGFVADDQTLRAACQSMIGDLKNMIAGADDCELHLHAPLNSKLIEQLKSRQKLRLPRSFDDADQPYRQRRSFFFRTYHDSGYRELVSSLAYGKSFLESTLYDGNKTILGFRPGGWDHGGNSQETQLYFYALADAGLIANSGLSTGDFGGQNWRVGNDPGHNLATIGAGEKTVIEVSPTAGPGGYLNPVLPSDLRKLAGAVNDEMPVIVAVYHLGSLQRITLPREGEIQKPAAELQAERETLERHFRTVAELTAAKVLYPITLRDLLSIISNEK